MFTALANRCHLNMAVMDVDSVNKKTSSKKGRGKIEKRRKPKNLLVFPKPNKKRGKTGKK